MARAKSNRRRTAASGGSGDAVDRSHGDDSVSVGGVAASAEGTVIISMLL